MQCYVLLSDEQRIVHIEWLALDKNSNLLNIAYDDLYFYICAPNASKLSQKFTGI